MEFLQVGELLTKIAELVLPPLFGIAAAFFIVRLLNPAAFGRAAAVSRRGLAHHHRLRSAREALEAYGLEWLVPFAIIITFIAAVLVGYGLLAWLGGELPPQIVRDDIHLIPPTIDRPDRLLLIRKYPGAENYKVAYDLAVKAWDLAGKRVADDAVGYYLRIMRMAKYLAIVALLTWIFGRGRPGARGAALARLLGVLLACAALWGFGAATYVHEMERFYTSRWHEIRNTLRVEGYSRPFAPPSAAELGKMADEAPQNWWSISWRDD